MNDKTCYQIPLSAGQLMAKSRELTGIDLIDEYALEPLTVLLNAFNAESGLHEKGAVAKEKTLLRILSNRLRMQRDFKNHPEIANEKIERPLIAYGMARSGTTKTQKLLAASGDFNWLPYWQTYNPSLLTGDRGESAEPRIQAANDYTKWLEQVAPESVLAHAAETFEPEEDTLLSDHFLLTSVFYQFSEIPSYLVWMATQDMTRYFEQLKDWLKYLQWQGLATGSKRWLLKSPIYYGMEPLILKVFPDADLVMTHRHPNQTVPSSLKLLKVCQQAYGTADINVQFFLPMTTVQMNAHMDVRENMGLKVLDINSVSTHAAADKLAERIYEYIGEEFSDASRQRIIDWEASNPKHKKGKFKYSLEEFGLSEDDIAQGFFRYIQFFENLPVWSP